MSGVERTIIEGPASNPTLNYLFARIDERLAKLEERAKPSLVNSQVIEGGIYEHFRGRYYIVRTVAIHEASLKHMVVYEVYPKCHDTACWVRSLDEFCQMVDTPTGKVPRFRLTDIGRNPNG